MLGFARIEAGGWMKKLVVMGALMAPALFAAAANAQAVELVAKGSGPDFVMKSAFQSDATRTEVTFAIKRAVPGSTHTVCVSTDGCTYTFTLTASDRGKAAVKFDTHDGTLPPGYEGIVVGHQVMVDGVAVATYKPKR